jgi:RNA polymerase sigma-70 factor (ECF subfamily)
MDDRRQRFETLILPYLDDAYRFARWLARSPESADDCVQEAMLRAYRSFDGLRGSDAKAWLLTIVRNCHSTTQKREQRRAQVPLPEEQDPLDSQALIAPEPNPENASIRQDEARTLERLVAALPEEYREVLILREVEDMDYRGIATVVNIPLGTVMSRLARARALLKKRWLQQVEGAASVVR